MTEAKRIMTMDDFEHRLLVGCINKARTEYMEEGKPTEDIDDGEDEDEVLEITM